jgi:hypothetical protein
MLFRYQDADWLTYPIEMCVRKERNEWQVLAVRLGNEASEAYIDVRGRTVTLDGGADWIGNIEFAPTVREALKRLKASREVA